MASLISDMHLHWDTLLVSYQRLAALGALTLFLSEGTLLLALSISWKKRDGQAIPLPVEN